MIAIDSSAILAIINEEVEGPEFARILGHYDWIIGAPTAFESQMVVKGKDNFLAEKILNNIFSHPTGQIVPFTPQHFEAASRAFALYGKGRDNKAGLNIGDCMSYAISHVEGVPLLYKGDDFSHTDIEPAYRP